MIKIPLQKRKKFKRHLDVLDDESTIVIDAKKVQTKSSVYLKDYYDVEYVGTIKCGTPSQEYYVIYDTGSSDLWLPSIECSTCSGHNLYNSSQSSTYIDNDETFSITYGSGSVSGDIATDNFQIGDLSVSQVTFGSVTEESSGISSLDFDGVVGLAFGGIAQVTLPTILTLLKLQNKDYRNMFSMYYNVNDNGGSRSNIIIGGYDLSLAEEGAEWRYIPLVSSSMYWKIPIDGVYVTDTSEYSSLLKLYSSTALTVCASSTDSCYAIVDSGTSTIAIGSQHYDDVWNEITAGKSCSGLVCKKTSIDEFPIIMFTFSDKYTFPILPEDYVKCYSTTCVVYLSESSLASTWIIGAVFMESFYTLFDVENSQIGFACEDSRCVISDEESSQYYVTDDSIFDDNITGLFSSFSMIDSSRLFGYVMLFIVLIVFIIIVWSRRRLSYRNPYDAVGDYSKESLRINTPTKSTRLRYGSSDETVSLKSSVA